MLLLGYSYLDLSLSLTYLGLSLISNTPSKISVSILYSLLPIFSNSISVTNSLFFYMNLSILSFFENWTNFSGSTK